MKSITRTGAVWFSLLLACLALFLALRLRWLGHLLMWDEAMNLCSARAFASGGHDAYSAWFWRYPPMFNLLLLLAKPLEAGYLHRAAWIPIVIGVLQFFVFAALNRSVYGTAAALWSCLALSVMPGAVFFDVWLKQDCLVGVTGMLAIYMCTRQRWAMGGLALGFCFLSKEMAIFYALALAVVLATERRHRPLLILAAVAFLVAFWWYAGFSISVRQFLSFAAGTLATPMNSWTHPWFYYGEAIVRDLGWPGIALAAGGMLVLVRRVGPQLWPLALFAPAFLIITAAKGKAPWYMMTLFPALATLQGVAACEGWRWLRSRFPAAVPGRLAAASATAAAAILIAMPVLGQTYEQAMEAQEPGMWWASSLSRETAETLNRLVKGDEKVLITPMYYYEGYVKDPCPIFVIYLKDMPVLVRPFTLTAPQFVEAVRAYDLDWAMVSPMPGTDEKALIEPLMREYGVKPLRLRGAFIVRTTAIKAKN